MRVIEDIRWTAALLLALTALLVVVLGGPVWVPEREDDRLGAMVRAVLAEQANEGPFWGTLAPYVAQLEVVRGHLLKGDATAVYVAMNRLMDMLEGRENGIPPEVADRLFDYCCLVMPAKYHDVSRHIDRFIEHQFGEISG
ncbi:MAG: hypothetical protein HY348_06475 [Nitrospira defluvii]|nr:hypothetical protein [Nitrospira defluvii]